MKATKTYYLMFFLGSYFAAPVICLASVSYGQSVITDPKISRRCDSLLEKRDQKLQIKKKLHTLIIRNQKTQRICPAHKTITKRKLVNNLSALKRELLVIEYKINRQNETIIRRGCPAITL